MKIKINKVIGSNFEADSRLPDVKSLVMDFYSKKVPNFKYADYNSFFLNISSSLLNRVINACHGIYDREIDSIVVFCDYYTMHFVKSAIQFLNGELDLLSNQRAELIFINKDESGANISKKLDYTFKKFRKIATFYVTRNEESSNFKKIFLGFVKDVYSRYGYEWMRSNTFLFTDKILDSDLQKLRVKEENIFFNNLLIKNNFGFFTEAVLVLLAYQGINIKKILNGYKIAVNNSYLVDQNYNLSYKLLDIIIDINSSSNLMVLLSKLSNTFLLASWFKEMMLKLSSKMYTDSVIFAPTANSYSQSLFSGKGNKGVLSLNLKSQFFDYKITSDVNNQDGLNQYGISQINESIENLFDLYKQHLTSFKQGNSYSEIVIDTNDEENYGELLGILSQALIFVSIVSKKSLF
ncbi:hypothetical protein [Mycoplasma sp. Ms02]|uniref:hypothetical protein n=1 Tax=Mycoplasma sp. Ms02 TaxID=353851 RepID=UPI001C890149|nr:hypothetical protein [Mycoplasma sp. Ms02]QZE12602.1 hypothetical protein K4L35_01285 [Mycoplasma sp. Ms02]